MKKRMLTIIFCFLFLVIGFGIGFFIGMPFGAKKATKIFMHKTAKDFLDSAKNKVLNKL